MFNIPILIITFNRPDHVRRVIGEVIKQEPTMLFVCQDGPRDWQEGFEKHVLDNGKVVRADDYEKVMAVRSVINDLIDWPCELHTLYQEKNLGCGAGPITGIEWFFKNVEKGIVMEDDCLPHPDFFGYCEELLNKYNKSNVRFINATLYDDSWKCDYSYGFSRYMITGAWASWRRTFDKYDLNLKNIRARDVKNKVMELTGSVAESNWWYFKTLEIQNDQEKKSYWDYQMQIYLFLQDAVTIHPKRNLISNIGFDREGTHTWSDDGRGGKPVFPILPLTHPSKVYIDPQKDHNAIWSRANSRGYFKDRIGYLYKYMLYSKGFLNDMLKFYKWIKLK